MVDPDRGLPAQPDPVVAGFGFQVEGRPAVQRVTVESEAEASPQAASASTSITALFQGGVATEVTAENVTVWTPTVKNSGASLP